MPRRTQQLLSHLISQISQLPYGGSRPVSPEIAQPLLERRRLDLVSAVRRIDRHNRADQLRTIQSQPHHDLTTHRMADRDNRSEVELLQQLSEIKGIVLWPVSAGRNRRAPVTTEVNRHDPAAGELDRIPGPAVPAPAMHEEDRLAGSSGREAQPYGFDIGLHEWQHS